MTEAQSDSPAGSSLGNDPDASSWFGPRIVFPAYAGLSLLFFLPALLPGRQLYGTDYLGSTYVWETFASRMLEQGQLPAWLPNVYGGVPFFANPMDVYYPVSILLRLIGLPVHVQLPLLFSVQLFLAGVGMYLLARALGTKSMAAAIAGLLYMLNGFLVSLVYGGHDNRAIVVSLLPLAFFTVHGAVRSGALRWYGLGGLVFGAALLPFQIQSSYYLLLASGLWFAYLLIRAGLVRQPRALFGRITGGVASLTIAFGLAAVNFVPFQAYVEHSPRGVADGRGYDYSVGWSMPPEEVVGLAVPERSGILGDYVGANAFKLHTEYAGALTLLLLLVGGYVLKGRRLAWFFPVLGALGLSLAFGGYTPLYRVYYELLPGIDRFRSPGSAFFLVNFALVGFAALALDRLHGLRRSRPTGDPPADEDTAELLRSAGTLAIMGAVGALVWALAVTVRAGESLTGAPTGPDYAGGTWRFALFTTACATACVFWLRGRLSTGRAGLLLFFLVAVDLWTVDERFLVATDDPSVTFAPDEVATFLSAQPGIFRVHVLNDVAQDNYLTHFGIELVAGEHGNQLQSYNEFLGGSDSTYTDKRNLEQPQFLNLANVRYIVTGDPSAAPFGAPVFTGEHRGERVEVFENESALPRAFLVSKASRMTSVEELFERLGSPGFDPASELLLYERPPLPAPRTTADPGRATIVHRQPTRLRVTVSSPSPAYLVLTDNYYPAWTAEVDGRPVPILRAYHTFRAVPLTAGEHDVEFRFESRRLAIGFGITVATWGLLALGALLVLFSRAPPRRRPSG